MSHFLCDHGIDLSGAPCAICEANPQYDWKAAIKKEKKKEKPKIWLEVTEEEKKFIEEHRKKK